MDVAMDTTVSNERAGALAAGAPTIEAAVSAVSWPAIIAGAFVAASASLILAVLGSGLGLASVSPWPGEGTSATTFTVMTAIWLIVVQWIASGLGGYLTGRLRTKWVRTHTHEVFFRDTAHGFVTWAVATVIVAVVLASTASSIVGAGVRAASTVASGAAQGAANSASMTVSPYDVDMLFRSARPSADSSNTDARAEATRILAKGLTTGGVPAEDRSYLAQLIAARTGISQADAEKRLDEVTAQMKQADAKARQAADAARKAGALASLYTALSLLIGAFIASAAAALGGRQRDEHP
jgi:hypothetical protein